MFLQTILLLCLLCCSDYLLSKEIEVSSDAKLPSVRRKEFFTTNPSFAQIAAIAWLGENMEDREEARQWLHHVLKISPVAGNEVALFNLLHPFPLPQIDRKSQMPRMELANETLKGRSVRSKKEILELEDQDIDISRALLLLQCDHNWKEIVFYEAILDLMAMEIQYTLSPNAPSKEIIEKINAFLFEKRGVRFPPHRLSTLYIGEYTKLPSVLTSNRGVCLGASILYLSIAQRLNLPLIPRTPPGHIYLSYGENGNQMNIETTLHGAHFSDHSYLPLTHTTIPNKSNKQLIALALINEGGEYFARKQWKQAHEIYQQAKEFDPSSDEIPYLIHYTLILQGNLKEGKQGLKKLVRQQQESPMASIAGDYLNGVIDGKGLEYLLTYEDPQTREEKKNRSKSLALFLEKYPHCRQALLMSGYLAWDLQDLSKAKQQFLAYHQMDSTSIEVNYALSMLMISELNYEDAQKFFDCLTSRLSKEQQANPLFHQLEWHLTKHLGRKSGETL